MNGSLLDTFERIKQHAGPVQVLRKVVVEVPGKHFPGLQPSEQAASYQGQACEYAERHKFERHLKAWGAAHTGPGIRFTVYSLPTPSTTPTTRAS